MSAGRHGSSQNCSRFGCPSIAQSCERDTLDERRSALPATGIGEEFGPSGAAAKPVLRPRLAEQIIRDAIDVMQFEMDELHSQKAFEDGEQLVEIILDLYDDLLQKWEHFRQQNGSSSSDQFRHKSVAFIVQQRQREIAETQLQNQ